MNKINISAGSSIKPSIFEAISKATPLSNVEFDFNGVTVQVAYDSNPELILRDWERGMLRKSDTFTVNPYPNEELTPKEVAEDVRLKSEIEARRAASSLEYERKMEAKKAVFESAIGSTTLELSDPAKWQTFVHANSDGYGAACVNYAKQWALLMQSKIQSGAKLQDIAEQASFDADTEGITGFMYGAAVSMLSQCWIHGEELRRWHNLNTQIGNEGEKANESGGVLNPALLNIGS